MSGHPRWVPLELDSLDPDPFLALQMGDRDQDGILAAREAEELTEAVPYLLDARGEGEGVVNKLPEPPVGSLLQQVGPRHGQRGDIGSAMGPGGFHGRHNTGAARGSQ